MKTSRANISQIRELIADNRIKEALSQAKPLFKDTSFFSQFLLLSSKYHDANQALRLDMLSFEQASIEKSKVIQGFLETLSELESAIAKEAPHEAEASEQKAPKNEDKASNTVSGDGNIVISNASNNQININK
jgi:hypothetical protein